jgi:uncharacterized protein (TIGR00299 family) protein
MHIHIDPLGGVAGDMFLAAALDANLVDADVLTDALRSIGVGPVRIVQKEVRRGAIVGTHVHFDGWDEQAEHDHRHLSTILEMLDGSDLPASTRERCKNMFRTLGTVESSIHGIPLEEVHFHECGALDSIFDFVSAAWIIEHVDTSWSIAPISIGQGTIETDHGTIPVPVPATARLLEDFEMIPRNVTAELVTPTGATILRTLRESGLETQRPPGTVRRTGYGAGTRTLENLSNVVRIFISTDTARPSATSATRDTVRRLSCDIDDMNPELMADIERKILKAGALDVVRESVLMKKGRQGTRISVLCPPEREDELLDLLFRETTTFGIRTETIDRVTLQRGFETVETPYGTVGVKVGYLKNQPIKATPEFDDCARLAREAGVAVQRIYKLAEQKAENLLT